jgi:hypothetical protein
VGFVVDTANSVSTCQNHYTNVHRSSSFPCYSYERNERVKPGNALLGIGSTGKKGYFHFSDFKGFKKALLLDRLISYIARSQTNNKKR